MTYVLYKYSNGRDLYARRGRLVGGGSRQADHRIPRCRWRKIIAAPAASAPRAAAWDSMSRREFPDRRCDCDSPPLSVCPPGWALTRARASPSRITWLPPAAGRSPAARRDASREHRMPPPVRLDFLFVRPCSACRGNRARRTSSRARRSPQTNALKSQRIHSSLIFFLFPFLLVFEKKIVTGTRRC